MKIRLWLTTLALTTICLGQAVQFTPGTGGGGKAAPGGGITNSQGFQYGRASCGPTASPAVTSLAGCTGCCNGAVIPTGPLNPGQVNMCLTYCASAFPPAPSIPWWYWFFDW